MRVLAGTLLLAAIITGTPRVVAADADRPSPPTHLTVDDDTAPLAVTGSPAFGWQVNDARRGALQFGYELLVATVPTRDPLDKHVIWRSGEVHASVQSYVTANGIHVQPDRTYWWTVRTWDAEGHPSSYAIPARFDTGLADGDWHASWIRDPGVATNAVESFSLARKVVRLGRSPIVRARANASAGQQYELSVNGARVAHGPSFSYPDEQYYETTDIGTHSAPANRTCSRSSPTGRLRDRAGPRLNRASSRTSPSTTPTARARSSRPTARGASTRGRGSRDHRATRRATSSSTSTTDSIRPGGTEPGSTTEAGLPQQ